MAKLVFFRRTAQELATQGGEVYFSLNGRSLGKLAATDCFVELPAGRYQLQMYKTHSYGSMIGFADVTVDLHEGEELLVRYSAPAVVNQPGHITLFAYTRESADAMAQELEGRIAAERAQKQAQEQKAREGANNAVKWIIIAGVGTGLLIAICYAIIYASMMSIF